MNDTEGALVGDRYRLDQPIGRGRAGIVWLAFDTMLHRTVAAKRLYIEPDLPPDRAEEAREAALREGRQATRILHANAITVYDAFRDGDDVWLVMEYVPSRNMADFLAEYGQLTPEQAAFLGVQLGSALAVAHALGVPHRVVEPSNVLLADDGGVKITDIGIAGGPPDPAYRAPEVAKGEPATAGADTYSLGATLFAAVEGAPPFGPEGTSEPTVPNRTGPLTGALLKMLRTDPDLRPTMADSVTALKAITRGQDKGFVPPTAPAMPTVPVMPRPPRVQPQAPAPRPPKQRRPGPRVRPWQWWIVAVVVVTIIVVGIVLAI